MDGNKMICGLCGEKLSPNSFDTIKVHFLPNKKFYSPHLQEISAHFACVEKIIHISVPIINPNESA
jgi:hypothetical protein